MTGTMWATYSCSRCGWFENVNEGTATWKVLHDHNEAQEAEGAGKRRAAQNDPVSPNSAVIVTELAPATTLVRQLWRIWTVVVLVLLAFFVYVLVRILL